MKKYNYPGTIRGTILRKFQQLDEFFAYFHILLAQFSEICTFLIQLKKFLFLTWRPADQIVD